MLLVEGCLHTSAPAGLVDGPFHRLGYGIRIENYGPVDMPSRTADRLDKRTFGAKKSLFISIQNAHQRDLREVQSFAQEIDPDQDVKRPLSKLPDNLHPLKSLYIGVEIADPDMQILVVFR